MYIGYGWRAKIAQLYPSGGQCDFEVQRMAPEGVQFVTTRLTFTRSGLEDDHKLVDDIEVHAQLGAEGCGATSVGSSVVRVTTCARATSATRVGPRSARGIERPGTSA